MKVVCQGTYSVNVALFVRMHSTTENNLSSHTHTNIPLNIKVVHTSYETIAFPPTLIDLDNAVNTV